MSASPPPRAQAEGQILAPDGARLSYSRSGSGAEARVLLIHALAMDRSNWSGVIAALPEAFEVLAVDCRGHGRSEAGAGPFTLAQFADDLARVLEAEGWADAVVAGCSMGGCVAQALAARHPSLVAGLALIDTTAWYGEEAPANWARRADQAQAEGLASLLPFQRERWFSEGFRAAQPQAVAAAEAVFLANDLSAYARSCAMLGAADLRGALAGFAGPAEVILGEEDYATPLAAAEALAAGIPGAGLHVLAGARHFTPIERPEEIAAAITRVAGRASGKDIA